MEPPNSTVPKMADRSAFLGPAHADTGVSSEAGLGTARVPPAYAYAPPPPPPGLFFLQLSANNACHPSPCPKRAPPPPFPPPSPAAAPPPPVPRLVCFFLWAYAHTIGMLQ